MIKLDNTQSNIETEFESKTVIVEKDSSLNPTINQDPRATVNPNFPEGANRNDRFR